MTMPKIAAEIPSDLAREIDRVVREGWFADQGAVVEAALRQLVDHQTFLGDSPKLLHRFAADALNESKPETALKFIDRAISLVDVQKMPDLSLYQQLVELRVQICLVLERPADALHSLRNAKEKMPNNPLIQRWLDKLEPKTH